MDWLQVVQVTKRVQGQADCTLHRGDAMDSDIGAARPLADTLLVSKLN
jgi:hypothetical protein